MTVREKFEKMLFSKGMFEQQAKAVMDKAIPIFAKKMNEGNKPTFVTEPAKFKRSKFNARKRKKLKLGEFAPPVKREVPASPAYKITWDSPAADYPDYLYVAIYTTTIREVALQWIDENIPMAWFREMFV